MFWSERLINFQTELVVPAKNLIDKELILSATLR